MRTQFAIVLLCALSAAIISKADESRELTGRVTRVIDGDTLALTDVTGAVTLVRLAQIDAPEETQPYGDLATAALTALTLGEIARVDVVDLDRYGRTVGEVHAKGRHVNAEMVRQGHAWAYTRYVTSLAIVDLEDEARKHQRGLWKLPLSERDAPWVWRHPPRAATAAAPDLGTADRTCGTKRTCKEMVSCAEARFYLLKCKTPNLDGDGDGNPCESTCRE